MFEVSNNQYFQGILQLRDPHEECVSYINNSIKASKHVFIAKEVKLKNGYDLYLSSQHFLQSLGRKLQHAFGGSIKTSQKLHTFDRQKSKKLYRVVVYYKCPSFRKGQVILLGNEGQEHPHLVRKISKTLSTIDLLTGKERSVSRYPPGAEVLVERDAKINKVKPRVEILDPETFQNEPVFQDGKEISKTSSRIGNEVTLVSFKGRWHLVPKIVKKKKA